MIRLRNALRPSSFPPPYPPRLPLIVVPARPPACAHPFDSRYHPTGGSDGCGGICQTVTHPHGRILGYVFARSPSPASSLGTIPCSFRRSHPPLPPLLVRFDLSRCAEPAHPSIRPFIRLFLRERPRRICLLFYGTSEVRSHAPRADGRKRNCALVRGANGSVA